MLTSVEMTHLCRLCIVLLSLGIIVFNSLTLREDSGMEEHVKEITDSLEANRRLKLY